MAGTKPNQTSFKRGNKAAKGKGRPPTPEDIRNAAKLGKAQFQGIFHKFSLMSHEDFKAWYKAGDMTVMERIIAGIMLKAAGGNDRAAALIWDRMMGRVTDKVEISLPKPMVIERPTGERIGLGHAGQEKVIEAEVIKDESTD